MKAYKVRLRLFQDDATGDYGVAPIETINSDYSFNAFWNGIGIFHDVFEHYFENTNKYFLDKYSINIGGEVAAMGHLLYYWNTFRPENRKLNPNSIYSFEENIIDTTFNQMEEAIKYGYFNYGNSLLCNVPRIIPSKFYNHDLENLIQEHYFKIKETNISPDNEYKEESREYKKSVTLQKLRNLYSWGYKQASKIIPDTSENYTFIYNFIKEWNRFCEFNNAKELYNQYKYLDFTVKPGIKTKYNAFFINNYEKTNYKQIN